MSPIVRITLTIAIMVILVASSFPSGALLSAETFKKQINNAYLQKPGSFIRVVDNTEAPDVVSEAQLDELLKKLGLDFAGFQKDYLAIPDDDKKARISLVKKNKKAAELLLDANLKNFALFMSGGDGDKKGLASIIAEISLETADKLATDFSVAFQNPRYAILTEYYKNWSQEQRLKNLEADQLMRSGVEQETKGNIDIALQQWNSAGLIYNNVGNFLGQADVSNNIGKIFHDTGNYYDALTWFKRSLQIRQDLKDRTREWSALTHMAATYNSLGDYSKALFLNKKALAITKQIDEKEGQGQVHANLGNVYLRMGNTQEAMEEYRQSLIIFRGLHDLPSEGMVLNNMATGFRDLGRYEEALKKLDQALVIAVRNKDKRGQGFAHTNIGTVFQLQSIYDEALKHFRRANMFHEEARNLEGIAAASINIGAVYQRLGQYVEALASHQKAQNISVSSGSRRTEMLALINIASVYSSMGDYDRALSTYDGAYMLADKLGARRHSADILTDIGIIYLKRKHYSESLKYFVKAHTLYLHFKDLRGEAATSMNIGLILSYMRQDQDALKHFERGIEIALEIGDAEGQLIGYYNTGRSLLKLNKNEEALEFLEKGIESLERVRGTVRGDRFKVGYLKGKTQVYTDTIWALFELHRLKKGEGYDLKAFKYAERAKSRAILDLIAESGALVTGGLPSEIIKEKRQLNSSITSLETNLHRLRNKPKAFWDHESINNLDEMLNRDRAREASLNETLRAEYPQYAELIDPHLVEVKNIQNSLLKEREVLLEYVVTDYKTFLFIVSKTKFKIVPIDLKIDELNKLVKKLRTQLGSREPFDASVSAALYEKIFKPAEQYLPKRKSHDYPVIYVVPDKALYYVPFEALSHKGEFLLNDYSFAYAPSASVLSQVQARSKMRQEENHDDQSPILIFADPTYPKASLNDFNKNKSGDIAATIIGSGENCGNAGFDRLPGTLKEADALTLIFQIDPMTEAFNIRERAKESRLKNLALEKYRYLHFATHGIICDETKGGWMQPSLVLSLVDESKEAQALGNEGFLQMDEIFGLQLKADLVTLSACKTGLGENVEGEGLLGLSRAFLYAGAQTVVVSLWSVSDPSTAVFMKRFYRNLAKPGMNKAKALAKVKRWMFKYSYHKDKNGHTIKHSAPYFWAPFILIGMKS